MNKFEDPDDFFREKYRKLDGKRFLLDSKIEDGEKIIRLIENDDDDESIVEYARHLFADPKVEQVECLLIDCLWSNDDDWEPRTSLEIVDFIVANKDKLPNLTCITMDAISTSGEKKLFAAFPNLENFKLETRQGYGFPSHMPALKKLIMKGLWFGTGNLSSLAKSHLPNLESLVFGTGELWDRYNVKEELLEKARQHWTTAFKELFNSAKLPKLKYLGVENCCDADILPAAIEGTHLLKNLSVLSFSDGTFSDVGAKFLLESDDFLHLNEILISYNFISPEMKEKLKVKYGEKIELSGDYYNEKQANSDHWDYRDAAESEQR